jgi:zinc transport system permease protein
MIAVSVVVIIRVVGLILVIALLTIPPFIAEKYARSLLQMIGFAGLLSAGFTVAGLYLAYRFNLTCGATIILVAAAGFFTCLAWERLKPKREGPLPAETG